MNYINLTEKDKKELCRFLEDYSRRISMQDLNEIEDKLYKKLKKIKKGKSSLPDYAKKMICEIEDLALLLNSPTISQTRLDKVIAALHYFIWAEDRIPDYIPIIGYLDDAYVISTVYNEVKKDIKIMK